MDRAQFLRRVKFILKFGRALHSVGAPAHTLEGTLQDMCQLFGLQGNIVLYRRTSYTCDNLTAARIRLPLAAMAMEGSPGAAYVLNA